MLPPLSRSASPGSHLFPSSSLLSSLCIGDSPDVTRHGFHLLFSQYIIAVVIRPAEPLLRRLQDLSSPDTKVAPSRCCGGQGPLQLT